MKLLNKVMVVTGAAGGIGKALVGELLKRGAYVAAIDINEQALFELKSFYTNDHLSTHIIDITSESQVASLPDLIIKTHGAVDGIINNAGIIQPFEPLSNLSDQTIHRVMNINFFGTLNMTRAFLPYLQRRDEAHIINISSMGGFLPVPLQTVYGASKAAVKLLTEGLYAELMDTNIHVSVVMPGGIETNITKNSGAHLDELEAKRSKYKMLQPQEVAEKMINKIEKNRYKILLGTDSKAMDIFYRLAPKRAIKLIAHKLLSVIHSS
jgi:short-subunit dehydrogenase